MVEIARVLSMDCKIIVMDEPTDTLTYQETEFLFNVIQTLEKRRQRYHIYKSQDR